MKLSKLWPFVPKKKHFAQTKELSESITKLSSNVVLLQQEIITWKKIADSYKRLAKNQEDRIKQLSEEFVRNTSGSVNSDD